VSRPCVEQLISYMLGGGNPLTVGVGIIIEVIRKNNSDYDPDMGTEAHAVPSSRDPIYLGTLLRLFAQNVPNFMSLIMSPPSQKKQLDSTFGGKLEPLGFDRFKTCELMAELLHCSNMGLLNEVGSEQLIAARDAERQRLRDEGKLGPQKEEDMSTDDLTMRMSQPAQEEGRRLEVTNADDDGFEEVEPSKEMSEDTSHEFVKAEADINSVPTPSFIDKDDDDFVDEPLSSPRLSVAADKVTEQEFAEPDLVVAPLSPTKSKSSQLAQAPDTAVPLSEATSAAPELTESTPSADVLQDTAPLTRQTGHGDGLSLSFGSDTASAAVGTAHNTEAVDDLIKERVMSPHPEDTPAPLFSAPPPVESESSNSAPVDSQAVQSAISSEKAADGLQASTPSATTADEPAKAEATRAVDPVVGDYLKIQFVDHGVVPTILVGFTVHSVNFFVLNIFVVLLLLVPLE
jgi:SIT4-associating protein SAP185/190